MSALRHVRLGREAAQQYANYTKSTFAHARADGGSPVFIPAKNEEEDLPNTLLSIAANKSKRERSYAVVVDNGSDDETAQVARNMGAVVLDVPFGRKMAATKAAFEYAENEGERTLLFTDADTIVAPTWVESMTKHLEVANLGEGSAVFGNSLLWYGEKRYVDAVLSAAKIARGVKNVLNDKIVARGHNYGVQLDDEGRIQYEIQQLANDVFAGDEDEIVKALTKSGANMKGTTSLSTMVITQNDRVNSLIKRLSPDYWKARTEMYDQDYAS